QGTVTQIFTVNLVSSPSASLGPPTSATFVAGVPNSVLLTSLGAVTPVYWNFDTFNEAPDWLNLTDNGDGTAVLFGTPPTDAPGTFNVVLGPQSIGSF